MTLDDFLQRALSARASATTYILGKGGWVRGQSAVAEARAQPGRTVDVEREFQLMRRSRPEVHAAYMEGLQKAGLTVASLPPQACDCSGFVCWALGVARDSAPWKDGGWLDTNHIYNDALGDQRLFSPAAQARPGLLVVYPDPPRRGRERLPGHIGIVTAVDAAGQATRVLHCAPENYPLPPPSGLPHNSIAETGPERFQADPRSRYVAWRGFEPPAP